MKFNKPVEEFVPELQTFLKEFIRKARAPNFEVMAHDPRHYSHDKALFQQAAFKDPRFPQMDKFLGRATWNGAEWTIESRKIQNQKYRHGNTERHRKITKDFTKAIKIAVDHIVPFGYEEVMRQTESVAYKAVKEWREEGSRYSRIFNDLRWDNLYKEVRRLKDMGVAFITPEFQKIADEGLDLYELTMERKRKCVRKHHVLFIEHGRIAVTTQDVTESDFRGQNHGSKVYETFEQLPEEIATSVAMLKILNDGGNISGMGVRVSSSEYYVLVPFDSNAKA